MAAPHRLLVLAAGLYAASAIFALLALAAASLAPQMGGVDEMRVFGLENYEVFPRAVAIAVLTCLVATVLVVAAALARPTQAPLPESESRSPARGP